MREVRDNLASDWLEYVASNYSRKDLAPSFDEVLEMSRNAPGQAWRLILELVNGAPSMDVLGVVGAGPLEDLLSFNGDQVIDWLEAEHPKNDRLQHALGHVWQHQMSDAVWQRVRQLQEANKKRQGEKGT